MLVSQEYLDPPKVFVSAERLFEQFMLALASSPRLRGIGCVYTCGCFSVCLRAQSIIIIMRAEQNNVVNFTV